ncbi:MAG: Xaa-Pro peptidase family protein [Erysipelotrichaceae bacterium]|nr:Xaa-Pro peptidase family protein [Erysipelotrichaceae bacterium]
MNKRIEKLVSSLSLAKIDQMILSDHYNILYFTGLKLHVGERLLVLLISQDKKPILFVNRLFPLIANNDLDIYYYDDIENPIKIIKNALTGKIIGVDKNWPAGFLIRLNEIYQAHFVCGSDIIDHIRAIKDECEKKLMIKSSEINDKIMNKIVLDFYDGISEIEIANKLKSYFYEETGIEGSFEAIVAFQENGANPHAMPTSRKLRTGDSILIDMGGKYQDYCSDMTRTFFWKKDELGAIYDIVKKANLAAIAKIRPGVSFAEVDQAARSIINDAGYGQYFTHRTGHGIGLEVHEPYDVASNNHRIIESGMCFSIEPGIYIPNVGGVRIEDLVLVDDKDVIVLNHFSKDKLILKEC